MNRTIAFVLAFALLSACASERVTRVTGSETRSLTDSPRVAPAGFIPVRDGTRLEMALADGTVVEGTLQTFREPVLVPLGDTGKPLVGGATVLMGDVSGANVTLACRFRLLNPPRGVDGGGDGTCEGTGRKVDFLF